MKAPPALKIVEAPEMVAVREEACAQHAIGLFREIRTAITLLRDQPLALSASAHVRTGWEHLLQHFLLSRGIEPRGRNKSPDLESMATQVHKLSEGGPPEIKRGLLEPLEGRHGLSQDTHGNLNKTDSPEILQGRLLSLCAAARFLLPADYETFKRELNDEARRFIAPADQPLARVRPLPANARALLIVVPVVLVVGAVALSAKSTRPGGTPPPAPASAERDPSLDSTCQRFNPRWVGFRFAGNAELTAQLSRARGCEKFNGRTACCEP